jgi:hypothetical protein
VKIPRLVFVLSLSAALVAACSASVDHASTTTGGGGAGASGASTTSAGGAGGQAATSASSSSGSGEGGTGAGGSAPDASDDGACTAGATRPCATSCGSTGTETCASGAWGACAPPAEVCNLADDDCSGSCDDILGCRVGVDRSYDATNGLHFYTTTDSEASCCGYSVETYGYYYLYASAQPGLVPFYRCDSSGKHLYTTDATCGGATNEGSMGWIATGPVCGSVPLYALYAASSGDHFYTTSAAEAASAEAGGYVSQGTAGYVWAADCGGSGCTWPSPIRMVGSTTTGATGFPTAWYGFPVQPGQESMNALSGSVTVDNSANLYAEVLFILLYLPSGACQAGLWPSSTPEYGPPGSRSLAQFIVKAPTQGTFTVPIDLTFPGGVPMSSCVLMGLNGGSVSAPHDVTSSASLTLAYGAAQAPAQTVLGAGGEMCFGQSWGCQAATTDDAQSFANVTPVSQAMQLVALYGDISDSTFDGTSAFGAPPAGAWTATNDFYVYHGAECSAFGVASGTAGPGDYYASIPADAVHLLSVPLSGAGIGVSQAQVYKALSSTPIAAGDCLVTLWGLTGGGGFDNETQIFALAGP